MSRPPRTVNADVGSSAIHIATWRALGEFWFCFRRWSADRWQLGKLAGGILAPIPSSAFCLGLSPGLLATDGLALQLDLVSVVDQTVEDRVGQGGMTD